jgi:hypothetical protein
VATYRWQPERVFHIGARSQMFTTRLYEAVHRSRSLSASPLGG